MPIDPVYDPQAESKKGKESALKVINEMRDVGVAFRHPTLGFISLLYGDLNKGVRHILYRREREIADNPSLSDQVARDVVLKLIDVVLFGQMKRVGPKYQIEHEGYRAILAPPQGDQMNFWLLTGFKIN